MALNAITNSNPSGPPRLLQGPLCLLILVGLITALGCNIHFDVDSVPLLPDAHGEGDSNTSPNLPPGPVVDCDAVGLTECHARCRDVQTDPYFCGSCLTRCAPTETCEAGQCIPVACPFDPGPTPGPCDPIDQGGCSFSSEACIVTFFPASERFGTACESRSSLEMISDVGSPCTSVTECVENSSCVSWPAPDPRGRVCSRICRLETSEGCSDDEFCVNPYVATSDGSAVLTGLGFCTRQCSPTNRNTCPPGQACAPDTGFGEYACHANFRCMENSGFAGKEAMALCNRDELHTNGCPAGLICMPHGSNDRCMRPCAVDEECPEGTCEPGRSPWNFMKICTP